ncbi:hypothetical protein EAO71_35575, partial [Streptomyces sp. ms191]
MTEQTARPATTPRKARDARTAPALQPLGRMRPDWPRSFADRLTAPLPGVRAMARLAREGAVRPRPDGLRDT